MYIYEMWLLNETDAVKHFILISYIFTYYYLQYTPLLYPYNVPNCESSIVRNSVESLLLSAPSERVLLSFSQLQWTQILFLLMQISP